MVAPSLEKKSCSYIYLYMSKVGEKKARRFLRGHWSIEGYDVPRDFVSDEEIEQLYISMRTNMIKNYGYYDMEIIHHSIILGLHRSKLYDPKKASKLVFFQTVMKTFFFQEKSNEYNKQRKYFSEWYDGIDVQEEEVDNGNEEVSKADWVNKYVIENEVRFPNIVKFVKGIRPVNHTQLRVERDLLKEELVRLDPEEWGEFFGDRVSPGKQKKWRKSNPAPKKTLHGKPHSCIICSASFVRYGHNKTCSQTCSDKLHLIRKRIYKENWLRGKAVKARYTHEG